MKRLFILLCFFIGFYGTSHAQLGVAYHQSNLPFVGINYQIGNAVIPAVRLGVDSFLEEVPVELAVNFIVKKNEDYQIYAGLGGRFNFDSGIVIPVGVNLYPLENKNFGFHIEVAALPGDFEVLRGSWGIRYRFKKS